MTYTSHKLKPLKEKDLKKITQIENEISGSDSLKEIKMFKINLLREVGWKSYVSWFREQSPSNKKSLFSLGCDYQIFYRSGWFVIVMPMNPWKRKTMQMKFKNTLRNLNIILQDKE